MTEISAELSGRLCVEHEEKEHQDLATATTIRAAEWAVYRSGFVRKKNIIGIFTTRYAVLDDTTFVFYEDETEAKETHRYTLSSTWSINPIDDFEFAIMSSPDSVAVRIAVESFESLESWLLALTQAIHGPYRDSENFCSAPPSLSTSLEHQCFDTTTPTAMALNNPTSLTFPFESWLNKQDEYLFTKYWRRVYCRLSDAAVLEYCDDLHFSCNVSSIRITDQSRVIRLPDGFQGQRFGLSLLTSHPKKDVIYKLRFGTSDKSLLRKWIVYLNYGINMYTPECLNEMNDADRKCFFDKCKAEQSLSKRNSCSFDNAEYSTIQQFIAPTGLHLSQNLSPKSLYWHNFCIAVPESPLIIVEVYEHQRFGLFPTYCYSALNLLFSDPAKLSSQDGVKFSARYLRRAEAPLGYRWIVESEAASVIQSQHKVLSLIYSPEVWSTHPSYDSEDCDESGWTYASSFEDLRKQCSAEKSSGKPNKTDLVRRRRWLRVAISADNAPSMLDIFMANIGHS